jgi:hypothetical protein
MKITLGNIQIEIKKKNALSIQGAQAKKKKSLEKIENGLKTIKEKNYKYSEYRLKKVTGLSINTIKKYRNEIAELRKKLKV